MRMQSLIQLFLLALIPSLLISQSSIQDDYKHRRYNSQKVAPDEVLSEVCTTKNIDPLSLIIHSEKRSTNGYLHSKYVQTYKNLDVFGSSYILHSKNNYVISSNGYLAQDINIETTPTVQAHEAIIIAKNSMPGNQYFEDRVAPVELMILDKAFPKVSSNYSLVYKVEVYTSTPIAKKIIFVDALNGSILLDLPGLAHDSTPATAHTKYHGVQEIITEATSDGDYILQDLTRGDGITTYNNDLTPFRNASTNWDLTNANQDEVALDAHYATEKFYDLMLHRFNWDGLDGNGKSMNPVVHARGTVNYVNAYWDGNNAWFGNGDCHRGPLTTLEVVAHEFMHGITDYTSDLIYSFESGAINESMSDIFGKAAEYYFAPDEFDWQIGESFLLTDLFEPFRYMDDPKRKNMPAYYKGQNWIDGGGVHQHSAIGNLWFHLLVEGRSDTTELGEPYNVLGIGMDKAIEIVWQVQSNYLTPTSNYMDMYESSITASTALFGEESPELAQVIEAWRAVGLPQSDIDAPKFQYDVGVQIDFITQRQCLRNEFLPFTIRLVNFGSEDIPDNSGIIINIDDPNSILDHEFEFLQSIKSGESATMTIDTLLYITEPGREYISATADYDLDENENNNNFNLRPYRIDIFDPIYNSLDYQLVDVNRSCSNDTTHFDVFISNLSCNALEANTRINYTILNDQGETLKENFYILEEALPSGHRFTTADFVIGDHSEIVLDAYTSTNAALDRQPDVYTFDPQIKIIGTYYNDLSDQEKNLNELDIFNIENIVDYNGFQYLAKGGGTDEEFFYPCPDDILDFQSVQNYHNGYSNISACLDLNEIDNPVLSFDLVQFRDESDFLPELQSLRCRAKITWGEGANDYLVIDNQSEGIEVNHKINLPSNFKGDCSIEFINLTGTPLETHEESYLSYDVNMIRNLEIKNATNTSNEIIETDITIAPNPGSGLYQISSTYPIEYISVIDIHGKPLLSRKLDNQYKVDISTLDNGYYILTMHLSNGIQLSKPIIHIRP